MIDTDDLLMEYYPKPWEYYKEELLKRGCTKITHVDIVPDNNMVYIYFSKNKEKVKNDSTD